MNIVVHPASLTGEADCYDHDTYGHNKIISLRRGIKPRNPQHVTKNCETCGSNVQTTFDHNDIEWFKKREALQAKKVESFKASKTKASSALRSKNPTKRFMNSYPLQIEDTSAHDTMPILFNKKEPDIIKQSERGISINKEKDVNDLLRMYEKIDSSVNTPIMPPNMLGPDLNDKAVPKCANKQQSVAMFSTEAEDIAAAGCFFSTPTSGIYGKVGVNTFRNAIDAHYLPHYREYVAPPSIDIVRPWFKTIRYGEAVPAKGTLKKSLLPHSTIGSKTGHSKKRKESSSAMDSNPSQPSVSTPVDTGMHKEDQQVTGGPTSLGVTSKVRVNPQLSSGTDPHVLVDQTKSVSEGLETVLTQPIMGKGASSVARQIEEETSYAIKLEDLAKLVSYVQPSFKDLDSPKDDPVIVVDDSNEDEDDEVHATKNVETEDTLHKLELEKKKAEAEAALLKAQPSFPNVEQLKELLFTKTITSLTSQVAELKTLKWELPEEFVSPPVQAASVQAKLKTLDALPESSSQPEGDQTKIDKGKKAMSSKDAKEESTKSNSNNEITHVPGSTVESSKKKELKGFDFVAKDGEHLHLTKEQINAQKKIEEEQINTQKKIEEEAKAEAARREGEITKKELIDLLGPEVVNKYYNDKLQYDRYCDKILNRRAKSRITNCDILTRKGPITLKVYREDDTSEIILEFKASDLHLGGWREVVTACPNKKAELGIDLDRPLSEHDSLDRPNDLENKKRKHADDIHDFFRANKRLHQGPRLNDHARTFSSLLLAKIDKRNLNPLKQMRVIEQLRQ
ncbi:hypothetical protein Tco_1517612 [Tanacetum coccineum]